MKTKNYILIALAILGAMSIVQSANVHHYKSNGTGVTVDLNSANGWLINTGSGYVTATQAPVATGTDKVVSGDSIIIQKVDTWNNTTSGNTYVPVGVVLLHMGNTGTGFSTTNKVWFYHDSKAIFQSTLSTDTITIPYAVYAGLTIPVGSNAKYINSTANTFMQIGGSPTGGVLCVDGSLKLATGSQSVKFYSPTSGTQSALTGSGSIFIQTNNRLQFGLNTAGCQPILFNFTGTFVSNGQGINVYQEGVILQTDFTNVGTAYIGNSSSFIDLNGHTFATPILSGLSPLGAQFKNTVSGSIVLPGNATIGSIDGLPFQNMTLGTYSSNKYTIASDLKVNGQFSCVAYDSITATSAKVIHVPVNNPEISTLKLKNVTIVKDVTTGIYSKLSEQLCVYPTVTSCEINIKLPSNDVYRVKLYNMSGKMVKSIDARESAVISVSNLPKGIYCVVVDGVSEKVQRKVIVV